MKSIKNKIFISAPYSNGDVEQNVKNAMDISSILMEKGYAPYCPHLGYYLNNNKSQPYEKWLELHCTYLKVCDAVLRLSGESNGADKEVTLAIEMGIPVFSSIDELDVFYY